MSTSVIARGRLSEWLDRSEQIGSDWLTPGGAIRPSGGYKGTGLALVAEALAGILTGSGSVSATPESDAQGVFCIAIDVARLRPLDEFADEMERMLAYVRDVPLEDGARRGPLPRRVGRRGRGRALRDGVPVQQFTWDRLEVAGRRPRRADAAAAQLIAEHDLPEPRRIVEAAERVVGAVRSGNVLIDHRPPGVALRRARAAPRTRAGCPTSSRGC